MNSFRFVAFLLLFQALVAPTWATPLTASAAAPWKQDFTLRDYMNVYDFPEEQLSYPVEIPAGITPRSLRLLAFTGNDAHVVPFQLSSGGKGKSILFLRTDLPQGATRIFRLVAGFDAKDIPVITMQPPALQATGNPQEAVLGNSLLLVKVPAGHQEYAGGKAFSQAAAPILGLARAGKGSDPVAGTAQRVLRTTGSDPFAAPRRSFRRYHRPVCHYSGLRRRGFGGISLRGPVAGAACGRSGGGGLAGLCRHRRLGHHPGGL